MGQSSPRERLRRCLLRCAAWLLLATISACHTRGYSEEHLTKMLMGKSEKEVREVLGKPDYVNKSSNVWAYNGMITHKTRTSSLRAWLFFDSDGKVYKIEAN